MTVRLDSQRRGASICTSLFGHQFAVAYILLLIITMERHILYISNQQRSNGINSRGRRAIVEFRKDRNVAVAIITSFPHRHRFAFESENIHKPFEELADVEVPSRYWFSRASFRTKHDLKFLPDFVKGARWLAEILF